MWPSAALWRTYCCLCCPSQCELQPWSYICYLTGQEIITAFFFFHLVNLVCTSINFTISFVSGYSKDLPVAISIMLWQLLACTKSECSFLWILVLTPFVDFTIWTVIHLPGSCNFYGQIPLKCTPHQVTYFAEKNLYPLIVSVPVSDSLALICPWFTHCLKGFS